MKGALPKTNKSYIKAATGNRVWKYDVTGTSEEIEAFKAAQTKVVINDDTGNPIHFSTKSYGETIELGVAQNGNIYVNTENQDAIKDQIEAMGPEFAKAAASLMVAQLLGKAPSAPVAETVTEDASEDLSNI